VGAERGAEGAVDVDVELPPQVHSGSNANEVMRDTQPRRCMG